MSAPAKPNTVTAVNVPKANAKPNVMSNAKPNTRSNTPIAPLNMTPQVAGRRRKTKNKRKSNKRK